MKTTIVISGQCRSIRAIHARPGRFASGYFENLFKTVKHLKKRGRTEIEPQPSKKPMKPSTKFKTTTRLLLSICVLGCFTLLPKALAVSPPPDGGYPGGNTAEGQNALLSLTTGGFNTAVGFLSLKSTYYR